MPESLALRSEAVAWWLIYAVFSLLLSIQPVRLAMLSESVFDTQLPVSVPHVLCFELGLANAFQRLAGSSSGPRREGLPRTVCRVILTSF